MNSHPAGDTSVAGHDSHIPGVGPLPVGLVSCKEYEYQTIEAAVQEAIDLIGGIRNYCSPGMHVLVKPNLLMGAEPSRAVCTHPLVVESICRILTGLGCTVTIADSPGAGTQYRPHNLHRAYEEAGYVYLEDIPGVTLNRDISSRTVSFPEGSFVRVFEIITPVLDADVVLVISKLKTHVYTGMTGATKNIFGAIPGLDKPPYHARFQDDLQFGRMLVDLNRCIRPVLQIMDAVTIMEGNGPMSGEPTRLGAILASADYTALDIVACRLIGYDPLSIGSIRAAVDQGLTDESRIVVLGSQIDDIARSDIRKPDTRSAISRSWFRHFLLCLLHRVGKSYTLHPHLIKKNCISCLKCRRICPVDAISIRKGYPRFNLKTCIRCYCCHEMCDSHAIRLQQGFLYRILRPFVR
ncbi:MAG TPA: DUF362 domain-containing protein [Methanospirillum sp.]|nr:DUF362 domain-containing protein [Methanospirillum sp.]